MQSAPSNNTLPVCRGTSKTNRCPVLVLLSSWLAVGSCSCQVRPSVVPSAPERESATASAMSPKSSTRPHSQGSVKATETETVQVKSEPVDPDWDSGKCAVKRLRESDMEDMPEVSEEFATAARKLYRVAMEEGLVQRPNHFGLECTVCHHSSQIIVTPKHRPPSRRASSSSSAVVDQMRWENFLPVAPPPPASPAGR